MIAGAILAAGGSTRFGREPKQLAELDGRPLLEHAITAMVSVAAIERTLVLLGAAAHEIRTRVDFQGAEQLVVADWRSGQAASLRAAVAELGDEAQAVVVTLGDQPRMAPEAISRVIAAGAGTEAAARARYGGVPGHPVLLKQVLFAEVARLRGDAGGRDLLSGNEVRDVECGDLRSPADIDTSLELQVLRRQSRQSR